MKSENDVLNSQTPKSFYELLLGYSMFRKWVTQSRISVTKIVKAWIKNLLSLMTLRLV